MMRKSVMGITAAAIISTFGCTATETEKVAAEPGKILVVYYSWGGNTRYAAEAIARATGGKLVEIKPAQAYPRDYNTCVKQAKKEIHDGLRPSLVEKIDVEPYDVIFVGSPNWWGTMAPPVATFLETTRLAGKTVVPFFTHGGGGMQNCSRDMKKLAANAKVLNGTTFSGSSVKNSAAKIEQWLNSVIALQK